MHLRKDNRQGIPFQRRTHENPGIFRGGGADTAKGMSAWLFRYCQPFFTFLFCPPLILLFFRNSGQTLNARYVKITDPGKTTVTLHMVAQVQRSGGIAGFIDAPHQGLSVSHLFPFDISFLLERPF